MHSAASHFAQIARKGNLESAYEALTKVTRSCVMSCRLPNSMSQLSPNSYVSRYMKTKTIKGK